MAEASHGSTESRPTVGESSHGSTESRPTEPCLGEVTELLAAGEDRVVLRLSRNIAARAREEFGFEDGDVLRGEAMEGPVVFLESGLRFEADVLRGQKTGFFLDQRENRRQVETLAGGRRVLNLFSYSGGFSIYAARGGAAGVSAWTSTRTRWRRRSGISR